MSATCQVTTIKAMNMVQVYIKGQEDKELSSFLRYYPVRIKNIGMDAFFDRQVIYDFKDGRNHADVAKCVAKMLVKKFGRKVRSVVFSCVPASSQSVTRHATRTFLNLSASFLEQSTAFPMSRLLANVPQFMALRSRRKSEQSA